MNQSIIILLNSRGIAIAASPLVEGDSQVKRHPLANILLISENKSFVEVPLQTGPLLPEKLFILPVMLSNNSWRLLPAQYIIGISRCIFNRTNTS